MLNLKRICLLAFVLLVCGQAPTLASGAPVALHVIAPESGFTDLDLENRLGHIISGLRGYQLIRDDNIESWISEGRRAVEINYSKELQTELADRFNARYLVWVRVLKAETFIKSGTLLPFLFKSHKRKFQIEVELRIIDSKKDGIILSKRFTETLNGSRALAYLDLDASNEPALMAAYPEVSRNFRELEERMAVKIAKELLRVTRKR
jgi:hypothetical protein